MIELDQEYLLINIVKPSEKKMYGNEYIPLISAIMI